TLHELMQRTDRFRVRALVRPEEKDHPILKRYAGDPAFEVVWGDLTNYDDILRGVTGADQVLHIGGMVSPLADHFPELTMKVNVGGAHNIVEAIKAQPEPDRIALVYIGTVAQTGDRSPPIHWGRTGDPIKISTFDHYAVSKTQAEALVAESRLKRWVSLRQTGMLHPGMWKIHDPIVFHNPWNGVFEWSTVGDSGRLAANTCEDGVPDAFWRGFYNIGGGEGLRCVNHEFATRSAAALGARDFRDAYLPNWSATRNFHGQWYTDSDRLEQLVPYRRDTFDDFFAALAKAVPWYVKLAARLMGKAARGRMKKLAEGPGGTLNWIASNDEAHIRPYFGSLEEWRALPDNWGDFVLEQPSRQPSYLDHGYDTDKPEDAWTRADLSGAAEYRGSQLISDGEIGADEQATWRCAHGHEFAMSARLYLRGGHWCPACMVDQSSYNAQAKVNPFFAQVWSRGY
ncbi:MAG: NAD(P)-dependent oxidoreductase, partial [Novosphingobium sp.]|nr:NAD(P)-dependent oxidoreductase [Novosphingobium sp.]